jgi:steroid delta-isomerase-like uncharacterized protein
MSESANKALMQRWFEEVWNQGRESTIDELFHPQGKVHGFPAPDSILIGPEGFKTVHRQFQNIFGGIHIEIHDLIAEGDRVALHWTTTAIHSGDGLGFPATGKNATLTGASFTTCRNGQITEAWNFMDMTKLTLDLQTK